MTLADLITRRKVDPCHVESAFVRAACAACAELLNARAQEPK